MKNKLEVTKVLGATKSNKSLTGACQDVVSSALMEGEKGKN